MPLPSIDFIKPFTVCIPATLHLLQTVQKAAIFPKYIIITQCLSRYLQEMVKTKSGHHTT